MIRVLALAFVCLMLPRVVAAADATLFRVFLLDGKVLVSYGEFARVGDQIIFSMPVGGSFDDPRLQVVTIAAPLVDWARTDRYAASARYQRYAETRGEQDFQILSNEVASVLNEIAINTDRQKALALAERARRTVAGWPAEHYGYRQQDVMEIVSLLDEAISALRGATGSNAFELSLVAAVSPIALEPMHGMPTAREQVDQLLSVATMTAQPHERLALLQSALRLINESAPMLAPVEAARMRRSVESQIREELSTDARYARMSKRVMERATRAAQDAKISDVERLTKRVQEEDDRLGRRRPELVAALRASVAAQLESARRLRLLRDQWAVRRESYRDYEKLVRSDLEILVKAQPSLEAIRKLEGPPPERLVALRSQLSGGANRLERVRTPDHLRSTHELLIGAWRFAENATSARYRAISSASVSTAWEASSAAAGALMMFNRAQQELRAIIEPPKLQ